MVVKAIVVGTFGNTVSFTDFQIIAIFIYIRLDN